MTSTNKHRQLEKEITSFINQNDGVLKRKGERLLKRLEKKVQRLEKEKDPIFQKRSLSARKGWETRRKKFPQNAFVARSAHHGRARDYTIPNHISINPENFLKRSKNEVFRVLRNHLPSKTSFKLQCIFEHINNSTGNKREVEQYLGTSAMVILAENSMEEVYQKATDDILRKIFDFTNEESGWKLKSILGLHLYVNDYNAIGGSSYKELSDYFKRKNVLLM